MKKIASLSILLCAFTAANAFAAEKEDDRNPIGCRDVGYQFDLKTLQLLPHNAGAGQSMYFIYNSSPQTVTLYQMRGEDSSRSMYLNHAIGGKQWAVLSTSERKMKYICATPDSKSRYGKITDCSEMLRVCEYINVKYGLNNRGNYWLVNSNTKNGAIREVVHYGIIPGV
ncbi:endopeptidase IV [Legionella dresdenensis]|uniref:Endopeptidase IV n=1 Tax=Legionella dresdenensis TaxID=450200 RepID=A0ABV8CG64_9GAMM